MNSPASQDTYPREMIDQMNENFVLRLDRMQETILLRIDAIHGVATETRDLAKKTNGRVDTLEKDRSYVRGALAVVALLVIPLLTYIFNAQLSDIKDQLARSRSAVLPAAAASNGR